MIFRARLCMCKRGSVLFGEVAFEQSLEIPIRQQQLSLPLSSPPPVLLFFVFSQTLDFERYGHHQRLKGRRGRNR